MFGNWGRYGTAIAEARRTQRILELVFAQAQPMPTTTAGLGALCASAFHLFKLDVRDQESDKWPSNPLPLVDSPNAAQSVADLTQGGAGADGFDEGRHEGRRAACGLGDGVESLGDRGSGTLRLYRTELRLLAFGQGRVVRPFDQRDG